MLLRNEVSLIPQASVPMKLGWNHISEQWSADRDDVSVWERVGLLLGKCCNRFELCVVIKGKVATFFMDIPNNLPLGSERESLLSEDLRQILCGITANQTKDGVMQSVNFLRPEASSVSHQFVTIPCLIGILQCQDTVLVQRLVANKLSHISSAVAADAAQRRPALISRPGLAATVAIIGGRGQTSEVDR